MFQIIFFCFLHCNQQLISENKNNVHNRLKNQLSWYRVIISFDDVLFTYVLAKTKNYIEFTRIVMT